jgi:hypothetical protein
MLHHSLRIVQVLAYRYLHDGGKELLVYHRQHFGVLFDLAINVSHIEAASVDRVQFVESRTAAGTQIHRLRTFVRFQRQLRFELPASPLRALNATRGGAEAKSIALSARGRSASLFG